MIERKSSSLATVGSRPAVLRVGGIDYLNALPLLYGLGDEDGLPPMRVTHHVPSKLASMLAAGALDAALVPVVAYPERPEYRIVPGIGISSYGAVCSIRLYHHIPLDRVRRVALDSCSRTSALLTRLLFRELWGGRPEFVEAAPETVHAVLEERRLASAASPRTDDFDAALLIGDAALKQPMSGPSGTTGYAGWRSLDLGTEWTRWTGLPFVYAFWACRDTVADDVERFHAAKDRGLAHIDEIVATARLPEGMTVQAARRYLGQFIQYDLGADKIEALRLFYSRLGGAGLIDPGACDLRFFETTQSV